VIKPAARGGSSTPKTPTIVAAVTKTVVAPHAYRSDSGHAHAGQRSHVVRPGESLWSIASDLLGSGASAARISREVGRLWQLNQDRIGSGDPDVITAGTTLILP
jgi:nucleoid-associated protein YgaU